MYTIRVKPAPRQTASYAAVASGSAATDRNGAGGSGDTPPPAAAEEIDQVNFSAGNPRVEHMVGRVSLFRHLPPSSPAAETGTPPKQQHTGGQQQQKQQGGGSSSEIEPAAPGNLTASPRSARQHAGLLPPGRTPQLCILALPVDMGFAELCAFMGAYFQHVRDMRLVRREGRGSACLVLLRFGAQQAADDFYRDYNGRAFCTLEPEILCRLLYVKEVEYQQLNEAGGELPASASAATAGAASTSPPGATSTAAATAAAAAASGTPGPAQQQGQGQQQQGQGQQGQPSQPQGTQQQGQQQGQQSTGSGYSGSGSGGYGSGVRAPPGTTELPTCPVCLERLDEHISGIVTTVCNHRFHNECLRQWGDTSCPVCRYCQHSAATTSHCAVCSSSADLWICLICGHVGCGRYRGSHAAGHWQASGHGYALELETQRVWDYVNDSYVHRLIQSKTDGKLVEVPSPAQHSQAGHSGRPSSRGPAAASECGSEQCYGDPEMEEAMVLSKLDALATEYNHLLVTQLESQRQYFETLLVRRSGEAEAEAAAMAAEAAAAQDAATASAAAAAEADRRRRQAESKLVDTSGRLKKAEEERQFLKQLSDSLLANQKEFQARLKAAEEQLARTAAEKQAAVQELQEQVRDLMVFLEARQMIEGGGAGAELGGGSVLPVPEAVAAAQQQQQRRGSGKRSGKAR